MKSLAQTVLEILRLKACNLLRLTKRETYICLFIGNDDYYHIRLTIALFYEWNFLSRWSSRALRDLHYANSMGKGRNEADKQEPMFFFQCWSIMAHECNNASFFPLKIISISQSLTSWDWRYENATKKGRNEAYNCTNICFLTKHSMLVN